MFLRLCGIAVMVAAMFIVFACDREQGAPVDVGLPDSDGSGDSRASRDTASFWLQPVPDWGSVDVFMKGGPVKGKRYRLVRADGDSTNFREMSSARPYFNVWEDGSVVEGRTYYYRAVVLKDGREVKQSPVAKITYYNADHAVRMLGEAYNKRDMGAFESLISEDFSFDGGEKDGSRMTWRRADEMGIHKKMFGSWYGTGLKELTLGIGKVVLRRTTDEEDYLGFLCFEAEADVRIRLGFDRRLNDRAAVDLTFKEIFRIRHSTADPTQWAIYRWCDPE